MFAQIKQRLGIIEVEQTPTYIVIEGIGTYTLFADMYRLWGNNTISKYMFSVVRSSSLKMRHFFGLDFLYVCQTLYDNAGTRTPRRVLKKIIDELKAKTWLGNIDRDPKSITHFDRVQHGFMPFPFKPFQEAFIHLYGKMVPAYRLRGYMLDAAAGTGKSLTQLALAASMGDEKVIIVTPKNALHRVWEDTLKDIVIPKRPIWTSDMDRDPSLNDHYYLVHYEALGNFWEWMRHHLKDFKGAYIGLDESHNFNRQVALRTQTLIDMIKATPDCHCLWASGTPLLALGSEMIPFLKCVDPLFDDESEERFRKIYGRDAKRANDILRNRIGHLKYHVPKQDVVEGTPTVNSLKVKIPNGAEYTLDAIRKKMEVFIDGRLVWYRNNFKLFRDDYDRALTLFEATLRGEKEKKDFKAYKEAFRIVSSGFDPRTMKAEAMLCNSYELRTIYPMLPNDLKPKFKSARSVLKYVQLKVLGEALGGVLGRARTQCHVEMVPFIDLPKIIDGAKKKTLIFTSFVEVVDKVDQILSEQGYNNAKVYGATNKDLPKIVAQFYKDPDLNPLSATYQSLSTAVPLTAANTLVLINQPFRSGIREQTIARAHRLGQDTQVEVFDCLLDTGDLPNISTRSNDIMEWSQQQVAAILGTQNVDLDSLELESRQAELDGYDQLFDLIKDASMESAAPAPVPAPEKERVIVPLPAYLYHGSMYKQDELMPGFKRSGQLVRWDKSEDNTWLYTSDNSDDAAMLGLSSAIEKKHLLDRYRYDKRTKTMTLDVTGPLKVDDLYKLDVYLYTLRADKHDGWVLNYNPHNGIEGEYKTQETIDKNVLRCVRVDVRNLLRHVTVKINSTAGYSTESLSDIVKGIRMFFGGGSSGQKKAHGGAFYDNGLVKLKEAEKYIKDYFANKSWVEKQEFNPTVPGGKISNLLTVKGHFDDKTALSTAATTWKDFVTFCESLQAVEKKVDQEIQDIDRKYAPQILKAVRAGDHDGAEELVNKANKEFAKAGEGFKPMLGKHFEGFDNGRFDIVKGVKGPYAANIHYKQTPVQAQASIQGLDAEGVMKAAAVALSVIEDIKSKKDYWAHYLDFEDGNDFWQELQDFDESLYMTYGEDWYWQTVDNHVGVPNIGYFGDDVLVALITWMDRSIK